MNKSPYAYDPGTRRFTSSDEGGGSAGAGFFNGKDSVSLVLTAVVSIVVGAASVWAITHFCGRSQAEGRRLARRSCNGSVPARQMRYVLQDEMCPACGGRGRWFTYGCAQCGGRGRVQWWHLVTTSGD